MSTDQARPKRPWGRMLVVVAALLVVASGCELAATWTPAGTDDSVPERPDRVSLSDVACPDTAACVAIGTQQTVPGSTLQLLVLRQVGSGWQRLDVPAGTSQLLRVGCRAVDDCVISATPADLHVGPGSVTTIPGTSSPDFYGERTIDCVAAGCVEVGADTSRSWDGSAWSADVPLPDDFPPIDRELACTAVDHCVLVATDVGLEVEIDTPARVQTTIWDGTGWSTPTTLDHETRTHGLDCRDGDDLLRRRRQPLGAVLAERGAGRAARRRRHVVEPRAADVPERPAHRGAVGLVRVGDLVLRAVGGRCGPRTRTELRRPLGRLDVDRHADLGGARGVEARLLGPRHVRCGGRWGVAADSRGRR